MWRDEDVPPEESSQPTGRGCACRCRSGQRSRRGQDQEDPRAHRLRIRCDDRPEKIRRTATGLGGKCSGKWLRSFLRQDTQGHVRGRTDSALRELWHNLGPTPHDGPNDGHKSWLCICHIHKSRSGRQCSATAGLYEVIIYSSPDDKKKNRGFCFLEYESHKAASLAKRRLGTGRIKVWGCDIIVDWADPQEEPDEQTMSKVKVLYVRNLTQDVSEDKLKEQFEQYGKVERVKKIKDYAFIHFEDRDSAVEAMRGLNGKEIGASNIEVSLAKPPSDKKKKEEILRARERRMMQMMQARPGIVGFETLSPYRNLSPTHPSMMSLTPMRLQGARMPLRTPIPREYGSWSWAWNHSAAWQSRWPTWQHQSSGGPNSATGGGSGSGGGTGGGGGSSAGGHRSGGAGSNRGGPWGGANASQRSWHPARQAATKFTSWSCTQDIYGGQLSVAHRSPPQSAARVALRSKSVKPISPHVARPSHTSPRSIPTSPSRLGPKKKRNPNRSQHKTILLLLNSQSGQCPRHSVPRNTPITFYPKSKPNEESRHWHSREENSRTHHASRLAESKSIAPDQISSALLTDRPGKHLKKKTLLNSKFQTGSGEPRSSLSANGPLHRIFQVQRSVTLWSRDRSI
ncbi:uncharacterized protein LOC128266582 isoform X17 [Drosophila gunungcola]|uniref:uncharacterized protein LOC128266582 isoform X17 n=1 Tax=Drosophila gunungcola TaxID=103775 RepID=UPI0022DEE585|nr:uncharacterized protein LOC128266582 isoform X17 [Drosophila gunungcola]